MLGWTRVLLPTPSIINAFAIDPGRVVVEVAEVVSDLDWDFVGRNSVTLPSNDF